MMKNRLVEIVKESLIKHIEKSCLLAENIANDLLANGVVVMPCKVGDKVYMVVNDKRVKQPYECKVIGFWYSKYEDCCTIHLERYVNGKSYSTFSVRFTDVGKTVFLNREDAERALKGDVGK